MTRQVKKAQERFFAEQAARLLGRIWVIDGDRDEHPDFIVTEGKISFGLEVSELFIGSQGIAGSEMKAMESRTQKTLNDLRREYEAIQDIQLTVKFVGNDEAMAAENLATVIPALIAQDLVSKPICYQFTHDTSGQYPMRSPLRVFVTKALRPNWYSVLDRVGFIDRNPQRKIADAIERKAHGLARYRETAGSDIRLLLVANRIQNSGKLLLEEPTAFDLHGFDAVYLLSFPESAITLGGGPAA